MSFQFTAHFLQQLTLRRIKAETPETSPSQLMLQQAERKTLSAVRVIDRAVNQSRANHITGLRRRERRTETAAYFVSNSIRFVSIGASSGAAETEKQTRYITAQVSDYHNKYSLYRSVRLCHLSPHTCFHIIVWLDIKLEYSRLVLSLLIKY